MTNLLPPRSPHAPRLADAVGRQVAYPLCSTITRIVTRLLVEPIEWTSAESACVEEHSLSLSVVRPNEGEISVDADELGDFIKLKARCPMSGQDVTSIDWERRPPSPVAE